MTADRCLTCGHHFAHHGAYNGECNYIPDDDVTCLCQRYVPPLSAAALRRVFDSVYSQPIQPNPWDKLMTEALNSAEETGRVKERARFQALLDEWETDEPGNGLLAVMGLRRVLREGRAS